MPNVEHPYKPRERRAILKAIRLEEGPDAEELIAQLADFAMDARAQSEREPRLPYRAEAEKQLDDLDSTLAALHPRIRAALQDVLNDLDTSIEYVTGAVGAAREQLAAELPRRARPTHPAAELFVTRCFFLWLARTGEMPPRTLKPQSPFHRFVRAAMPSDVYVTSGRVMAGGNIHRFVERVCRHARKRVEDYKKLGKISFFFP